MKVTAESTEQLTTIDGVEVRAWKATTEDGVPCLLFVHRIAVDKAEDTSAFDRDLREQGLPRQLAPLDQVLRAFDRRMF